MARRTVSSSGQAMNDDKPQGRSVRSSRSHASTPTEQSIPEQQAEPTVRRTTSSHPLSSQAIPMQSEAPTPRTARTTRSGRPSQTNQRLRHPVAGRKIQNDATGMRTAQSQAAQPRTAQSANGGEQSGTVAKSPATGQVPAQSPDSARHHRFRKLVRRRKQEASAQAARSAQSTNSSQPGSFVDARALPSEDLVERTLQESAGTIGVATRPKVVDFKARLRERKAANTRVLLTRIGIGVAAFAALVALIWLLFFSPMLRLEEDRITINGANEWVNSTQIMNIAKEQVGKSLLVVSDNAIEQKLNDIPGVSSSTATKKFPRGLEISIVSQRPAAMLKVSGKDGLTAVDSETRVLNQVTDQTVKGIPVIEVKNIDTALKQRSVQSAVTILDAMPESWRTKVTAVSANTQDSVTTTLDNGITIVWGDSSDIKLKMAIVDKIMNDPNVIGDKKQINVSAPGRPIIK